jgi:phage portal protein, HK97 family
MALFRRSIVESGPPAEGTILNEESLDPMLRAALSSDVITEEDALQIPAVNAAVNFISYAVSGLKIRLYKSENGETEEITDDYRLGLLNRETGDLLDAYQLKAALVKDYLLAGNGYAYVHWVGMELKGIYYVDPIYVSYDAYVDPIFKKTQFYINGQKYRDYKIMRVLRETKDGITGRGLVRDSDILLGTMLASLKYESKMVKTGGKKGFLKTKGRIRQDLLNELKKSWRLLYSNDSDETIVVLNDGLEYQDAGQTAVESQLNQNKDTNSDQVLGVFGIVSSIFSGNATENDVKNTVEFAIKPVAKALETAINRFCLLESEKGTLEFEVDLDDLDMTNILTRYQAYEVAVRNGWMQLDEVRYEEGRNPLGLDFIRLGLDTVIYDPVRKEIYTPNTKEWVKFDSKSTEKGGEGADESGDQSGQEPDDR